MDAIEGLQVVERSDDAALVTVELGCSGVTAHTRYHRALGLLRGQVDAEQI